MKQRWHCIEHNRNAMVTNAKRNHLKHMRRAAARKLAREVEDKELPELREWTVRRVSIYIEAPFIEGLVYGRKGFLDGELVSTSLLRWISQDRARTISGTLYKLGGAARNQEPYSSKQHFN